MKDWGNKIFQVWLPALLCGVWGALVGLGVSTLFPTGDFWFFDWQVAGQANRQPVAPSITLVTLDETGPASCGPGHWNAAILAQTITALNQAQAKIIAPALALGVPTSPECGDTAGFAKLIEATKQAGNVVYPSSVPYALAGEASMTGVLDLQPDEDNVFRRIGVHGLGPESAQLPLGLAMASSSISDPPPDLATDGLFPLVGQWSDRSFQTFTFGQVWELVTARDRSQLSVMVKDKFVIMFPIGPHAGTLTTPLENSAPLGFLHANILQTALSSSWVSQLPWEKKLGLTLIIAILAAWLPFRFSGGWGLLSVALLLTAYGGLSHVWFQATKQFWPFVTPLVATMVAFASAGSWGLYHRRSRIEEQIKRVSARLEKYQEELAGKERLAEQLNNEATRAKALAHHSTQKYHEVAASVEQHQQQLQRAQEEVETTRQHLHILQSQLDQLHKRLPSQPTTPPVLSDDDLERLREECESQGILTRSPHVLKVFQDLKKAAVTNNPILLLGETGTGKELFARAAHHLSNRPNGPFISINIAAIRPELFESEMFGSVKGAYTGAVGRRGFLETADGGTLFLDEVGELPLNVQAKLLRVLEEGSFYRVGQSNPTCVDVRIVTATNRDLIQEVKEGRYREDLYYRLRSIVLNLPPLRERGLEDVDLLAHHFLGELSHGHHSDPLPFSEAALQAIKTYPWPGNIRELRQTIAQAVALTNGPLLTEDDLRLTKSQPSELSPTSTGLADFQNGGKEELARREDTYILSCLRHHQFDMQATAKALKWDRGTVTQRLKGMGFQALVDHQENVSAAAETLAGTSALAKVVEGKLREYYNNLMSATKHSQSVEEAIADSRRRFRNLPDRHFPAVETLIRQHFQRQRP